LSFWLANSPRERLIDLCNSHLVNYDIVCLQECFGVCTLYAREMTEIMTRHKFEWYCMPTNPNGVKIVDSGLIVFSKIPIIDYKFIAFTDHGEGADLLAEKGFQIVTLINGKRIINTHLQATVSNNSQRIQFNQAKQIGNHVNAGDILCGDFNINAYYKNDYDRLLNILKNPHDTLDYGYTHEDKRIDYIFYNGKCDNIEIIQMEKYSDHNAISGIFYH
jgi:endonuclease/exonuclease/phosphatase family metal-dependent hydrolase